MEWRHALLLLGFVVYQAPQTAAAARRTSHPED
jgi:hypothetical protein